MSEEDFVRHTVNLHPDIEAALQAYHATTGRKSLSGTIAYLVDLGLQKRGYDTLASPFLNWGGKREPTKERE